MFVVVCFLSTCNLAINKIIYKVVDEFLSEIWIKMW